MRLKAEQKLNEKTVKEAERATKEVQNAQTKKISVKTPEKKAVKEEEINPNVKNISILSYNLTY